MKVDKLGKGHYKTRNGLEVEITDRKAEGKCPIRGNVFEEKETIKRTWTVDGFWRSTLQPSKYDLIPVAETVAKPLPKSEKGYKIDLSEASVDERAEAQKLAFELGWEWVYGGKEVLNKKNPYQYFFSDYVIKSGIDAKHFENHQATEITISDLRAAVAFKKSEEETPKADRPVDYETYTYPKSDYTEEVSDNGTITLTPIDKDYKRALDFLDGFPEIALSREEMAKVLVKFLNELK